MKEIKFYRVDEPYGFFSNFSNHPIFIKGEVWRTVEHFFQASKFEDPKVVDRIRLMDSPFKAAIEGRDRQNKIRSDWDHVKDSIMEDALLCKFLQHTRLKKELLLTNDAVLIEHTTNDNYWADGGDGSGKNMLGKLLMKTRSKIIDLSDDPDLVFPPWIAFRRVSKYSIFWRMGFGEEYVIEWGKYALAVGDDVYDKLYPEPFEWEDAQGI